MYDTAEERQSLVFKTQKSDTLGYMFFLAACTCIYPPHWWGGSVYLGFRTNYSPFVVGVVFFIAFIFNGKWLLEPDHTDRIPHSYSRMDHATR
jgi:hypothetical protein